MRTSWALFWKAIENNEEGYTVSPKMFDEESRTEDWIGLLYASRGLCSLMNCLISTASSLSLVPGVKYTILFRGSNEAAIGWWLEPARARNYTSTLATSDES